jgi:regulatory protein
LKKEPTLRERALAMLARREYSRAELSRRLAPHAADDNELEALLAALTEARQLSDERYAEARSHVLARKYGAARIVNELKSKGIEGELLERMAKEARGSELERARAAWRRKFGTVPKSREERARHIRFLQSRGFSFEVIQSVLQAEDE